MTTYATSKGSFGEELVVRDMATPRPEDDTLQVRLAVSLRSGDATVIHEALVTVHINRRRRRQIGEDWS